MSDRPTRFWLIRHALVEEAARQYIYGILDVPLSEPDLRAAAPSYRALAERLPGEASWLVSPLSRTRCTAEAIFAAGYKATTLTVEPDLIEQNMGRWQGVPHSEFLSHPHPPFWPFSASEVPPEGESMDQVRDRVGEALERLTDAFAGQNVVAVSHGGTIRAAVAHAMGAPAAAALHLSIQNLSLTVLERHALGWRVVCVNDTLGVSRGASERREAGDRARSAR